MSTLVQSELPAAMSNQTPPVSRRGLSQNAGRRLALGAMTAPALIWYAFFMFVPAISMVVVSFRNWPGILSPTSFAGLANYQKLVADPTFWAATRNTAVELVIVLVIMIPVSFMLGYYLTLKPRGHRILRVLFFTPALLSVSARAVVFFGVFAPGGLVNGFLKSVGLNSVATSWLANPDTSLGTIIFVDLWGGIGFTAILFAARLSSVSAEVYEAAELDGANHWRKMWRVAFPVIKDYVGVLTMLQFLWILFYSATTVLLLTKGGPGTSSTTLSYMVYSQAFIQSNIGYSQAIGVVLFAVGFAGMVIIRRSIRQNY